MMVMAVVEMRNQTVVGTRGHISRGIRLPREIRVILPIGIICITIWRIGLWLVLADDIGMLCHQISH